MILVDDGSTDNTRGVINRYIESHPDKHLRAFHLTHNVGKGGALRQGVYLSRGEYVLIVSQCHVLSFFCACNCDEKNCTVSIRRMQMVLLISLNYHRYTTLLSRFKRPLHLSLLLLFLLPSLMLKDL